MKYDIYFHNDFDGRAASAVMFAFLHSRGDDIEHFVPMRYDIIPKWLDEKFMEKNKLVRGKHNPAIVVDFPFHPQAAFWFDHHIRPFRNPAWEKVYTRAKNKQWRYDDSYRSACHLVYDSLQKNFGWKPPKHLRELVKWLNILDFADYKSPEQTIAMKEPAIQTNVFIEDTNDDLKSTIATIKFLAEKPLDDFIKLPWTKKRIAQLRNDMSKSIRFHRENDEVLGTVVVSDLRDDPTEDLAHFSPYAIHPDLLYVIRFHGFPKKPTLFHINVGANPWRRKDNKKNIGELLKKYGGGGHKDVGGVEIQGVKKTLQAVNEIVTFLNK